MRKLIISCRNLLTRQRNHGAHRLSQRDISPDAIKVLQTLHQAGYQAYLVGGGVRDLLVGLEPKDFDVATNALPEQVHKLFRRSRMIGRRFRLVHVYGREELIEVATFRGEQVAESEHKQHSETGMILRDNVYGTLEEDACRRDFTVNALYLDINNFSVIDDVEGMRDIQAKLIRMIGEPVKRYREDPVRMLRAVRLAAKLDFTIHKDTAKPILQSGELLQHVPAARLFEEIVKFCIGGKAEATFKLLQQYHLFDKLFAPTDAYLKRPETEKFQSMLQQALQNTDMRVNENQPVNPAFLFAILLWGPIETLAAEKSKAGVHPYPALQEAMNTTLRQQINQVAIPRRFTSMMREIWGLQYHMPQLRSSRVHTVFHHPRFRAAHDFLLLRAAADEALKPLADWWTAFRHGDQKQRVKMLSELPKQRKKKK